MFGVFLELKFNTLTNTATAYIKKLCLYACSFIEIVM